MRQRPRALLHALLLTVLATAGLALWLVSAAPADRAYPACFGAATRDPDPAHACRNPALRLLVRPTPLEAQITPSAPCTEVEPVINVCAFGAPASIATSTVALVGDSHAGHWRAALNVVAGALEWQGLSITRSSCTFSAATTALPQPRRGQCRSWTRGVLRWFAQHPEVSTVFVSDHRGRSLTAPGESALATEVRGYASIWEALPASVKHIVVIRDNPYVHPDTLACVERAMARRAPAGPACAVRRKAALQIDPEVLAAARLHSPRVRVIDMTHFFCDRRLCYPVIGGALVYKDTTHLTRVFAATLGPFLLHRVGRLLASWY
jgi:hypothetical protein